MCCYAEIRIKANVCELELNRWFFTNCFVLKYYLIVLLEVKILSECARLILNERVKIAALYLKNNNNIDRDITYWHNPSVVTKVVALPKCFCNTYQFYGLELHAGSLK